MQTCRHGGVTVPKRLGLGEESDDGVRGESRHMTRLASHRPHGFVWHLGSGLPPSEWGQLSVAYRFVYEDVASTYLQIESTLWVGANPNFVEDRGSLSAVIRKGNEIASVTLLTLHERHIAIFLTPTDAGRITDRRKVAN